MGSGNIAHLDRFPYVPHAACLGVAPQDILDHDLPTHSLLDIDVNRARDALMNAPCFRHDKPRQKAMEKLVWKGVRAEQQALAERDRNDVIDEAVPQKLKQASSFLP